MFNLIFLLLSYYNTFVWHIKTMIKEKHTWMAIFLSAYLWICVIIVSHIIDELSWSTNLCCPNKYIKFNDLSVYCLVAYITCSKVWKIKGYKNPSIAFKDFHLNECREKSYYPFNDGQVEKSTTHKNSYCTPY